MPITTLSAEYGIHRPEDLEFLKSVFDEVQQSQKLLEPWQGTALARQILYIYRTGVRDRDLLLMTLNSNYTKSRRTISRAKLHIRQHQFPEGEAGIITGSIM